VPSLYDFGRRIKVRAAGVAKNADTLVRKVALVADQAVVSGTPVDTGRARSNWIATLGAAPDTEIEPYVPGELGSTAAANTQAAIDQAETVIAGYTSGQEIHITNNVPYIQDLNDGSSAQAPAGFVEEAVLEAVDAVTRAHIISDQYV